MHLSVYGYIHKYINIMKINEKRGGEIEREEAWGYGMVQREKREGVWLNYIITSKLKKCFKENDYFLFPMIEWNQIHSSSKEYWSCT